MILKFRKVEVLVSIKKELGEKIKRMRKKRGLTQEQLAETINVAPRTLSGIENGENFVTADTLDKIIVALNTTSEELFANEHLKDPQAMVDEIIKNIELIQGDNKKLEDVYKIITSLARE